MTGQDRIGALDLDYPDPLPSPGFTARAQARGRSIRRRRRAGGAAATIAALAVAVPLGVHLAGTGASGQGTGVLPDSQPAATATSQATSQATSVQQPEPAVTPFSRVKLRSLPYARGSDPTIGRDATGLAISDGSPATTPIVWSTDGQGRQFVTWFRATGQWCFGIRTTVADKPLGGCSGRDRAPAEGFWRSSVYAYQQGKGVPGGPVDTAVFGIVRGPVSRVVVDLPVSGPTDARLVPAPGEIGTLYWLSTRDYTIDATVVEPGEIPESMSGDYPRKLTVYRGDTPVFHCEGNEDCS